MNWADIAKLVIQEGLPVAMAIWQKWTKGTPPTQADFDELRALASQTALDRIKARLAAAGIAPTDPRYTELVNLVK